MSFEEWQDLKEFCTMLSLGKGEKLYENGDSCTEVYVLTGGCIKLTPANSWSPPRQVSALGLIGAEALIMLERREESAEVTSEGAIIYKLTQENLEKMRDT